MNNNNPDLIIEGLYIAKNRYLPKTVDLGYKDTDILEEFFLATKKSAPQ